MSLAPATVRSTYQPPGDCSSERADGRQRARRAAARARAGPRGEQAEGGEESTALTASAAARAPAAGGAADPPAERETGEDGRADEPAAERHEHEQPAPPAPQGAAPLEPRHVPDRLERAAERERHAEARPQRAGEPDDERDRAAGQRLDLVVELRADRPGSGRGPSRGRRRAATGRPPARSRARRRARAAAGTARRTRSRRSAPRGWTRGRRGTCARPPRQGERRVAPLPRCRAVERGAAPGAAGPGRVRSRADRLGHARPGA